MQCPSCNTELPKQARICPKCGTSVGKEKGNIRYMAIAGMVIMFIAGLLPLVQSTEKLQAGTPNYVYSLGYMNISMPVMWYIYMLLLVAGIILVVARKEIFSIITSIAAIGVTVASFLGMEFYSFKETSATGQYEYIYTKLQDALNNGVHFTVEKFLNDPTKTMGLGDIGSQTSQTINIDVSFKLGLGLFVMAIGLIIAIAGVFIDIVKPFKKAVKVDKKYLSNSINQSVWKKMFYYRGFYIMYLPVLVMILLFNYWPMLGCRYAFTWYKLSDPYYVGLWHFETMFTASAQFWSAFKNTLILSIIKLILNTGAAVIISLLLNEIVTLLFKKTVQTIIYLPHFMSWVVVASIFGMILAPYDTAPVNGFLKSIGLLDAPVNFLQSEQYWRGTFYIINIWKDTGWGTILFLATLSGISPDLYEAAQIDGANRFKRLIYITLPALANTIITVFILNLAKVMNLFESVFVLQASSTTPVSQVLQTYVYAKTFGSGDSEFGYTTAVGIFKSFIGMILVLGCNWASKKVRGRGIV